MGILDRIIKMNKVYDYVYETEELNDLPESIALELFHINYSGAKLVKGGCSTIAKKFGPNHSVMARNMDFYLSEWPVYIVRTHLMGCYKTVGLTYFSASVLPSVEEIERDGGIMAIIAYDAVLLQTDVINEHGLYIQVNMREENDPGDEQFYTKGTNPDADIKVAVPSLAGYLTRHCTNIDEVLKEIKRIDIYSLAPSMLFGYNFCCMIMDKTGRYGLLEIARNKISWLEDQNCQTNFYVTKEFNELSKFKSGVGRYDYLTKHVSEAKDEKDMFNLIDKTSMMKFNHRVSSYDISTEFVKVRPEFSNEYINNHPDVIKKYSDEAKEKFLKFEKANQIRKATSFWITVYTVTYDNQNGYLNVRFFEDEDKYIKISAD